MGKKGGFSGQRRRDGDSNGDQRRRYGEILSASVGAPGLWLEYEYSTGAQMAMHATKSTFEAGIAPVQLEPFGDGQGEYHVEILHPFIAPLAHLTLSLAHIAHLTHIAHLILADGHIIHAKEVHIRWHG